MIAKQHEKLGESHGRDSSSKSPGGTKPADTWSSDFKPPELWDSKGILFRPLFGLHCYYSSRNLTDLVGSVSFSHGEKGHSVLAYCPNST